MDSQNRTISRIWGINKTLFVTVLLVAGLGVAQAATFLSPVNLPPGGNPNGLITTGASPDIKPGPLKVDGTVVPVAGVSLEVGDAAGANGGFLPPRVTVAQRNGIVADGATNAALAGLMVYDTDLKQTEIFNGVNWIASNATTTVSVDGPAFLAYWNPDTVSVPVGYKKLSTLGVFSAPEYVSPPASTDFNPTTGIFKPTVPGKYLLTATNWALYGMEICKNTADPSLADPKGCVEGWSTTYGAKVTAVMDADGVNDYFQLWVYANGTQTLRGAATHYTFFSAARVGGKTDVVRSSVGVDVTKQDKMILYFNLASCPAGWTLMNGGNGTVNMQGMYVVGSMGSSLGQSPGGITRLSNLENRATGFHTHSVPTLAVNNIAIPGQIYYRPAFNLPAHSENATNFDVSAIAGDGNSYMYATAMSAGAVALPTGSTIAGNTQSGGPVAGTNAPYTQFLMCQQN